MLKKSIGAAICAALLFTVILGCKGPAKEPDLPIYDSYRDIHGVTDYEIEAIEALKGQKDSFVYAMRPSTETFTGENGEIRGFTALFCEWLTDLFGIPFKPAFYRWDELFAGLDSLEIDFTGDFEVSDERRKTYFMTSAIAERVIKTFRIEGSRPLSEIAESRPLRYAFLQDAAAITNVTRLLQDEYEIILAVNNDNAYEMLKNGEADAYFTVDVSQAAFDDYGDVIITDFFPLILNPVSLTTRNPALEPVISVVQKALDHGSIRRLNELYERGYHEYEKYKLFTRFSEEETAYIHNHPIVPFAAISNNYPVEFYNANEKDWQGVAFDVIKKVENLTGLEFKLVNDHKAPMETLLSMLENGEATMLSGLVRSSAREDHFLWADTPVMTDFYALISKSDYRDIGLSEIPYIKIGLIKDTAYAEAFKRWFPDHQNIVEYQNLDIADVLERGEVDMVMANEGYLLMMTHFRELTGHKANVIFNYTFEAAFAFNKSEPVLCSIVDKALKTIDTEIISERWVRKTYDYRAKMTRVQLPWIAGAVALFLTVLFVVILLLRKQSEGRRLEELVKMRTADLNQQHTLAQEINNAAVLLLASDMEDDSGSMSMGMQMIAKCINVDRISIWQNLWKDNDERRYYTLVDQWANIDLPQLDAETDFVYQEILPSWEELFKQKLCVNGPVENLSEPEQSQLGAFAIQSLLAIPIYVKEEFWGFISFDDYRKKRVFSNMEVYILYSWGLLAVGAVKRNEIMQKMYRTLNKLEAIINNYKGIIWSVDTAGIVTTFSGQFVTKMGMKPSYFEGKKLEYVQQKNKYLDMIDKQVELTFKEGPQAWASDTNERIFHSATMPIYDPDGNIAGVVGSTDEVTEFFKLQRELEAALEAAKAASRAKSAFLANMSHEMRTPMNAIIGMGAIGKSAGDLERKDHCFEKIENASKHLLGVINDILDMSKIEANKFELSPVDFKFEKMLQRVIDIITFRINEKHQKFTVNIDKNIPRFITGDDQRLAQVITNLLGNAVKFTPENGSIGLDAQLIGEENGVCTIKITVKDTGIGINGEQQKYLFLSFQQADTSTVRKFGGTGLGLAISKNIVEIMGGHIQLESEVGKGSTFSFTFPAKRVIDEVINGLGMNQPVEEGPPGPAGLFKGHRILLVDDVEINREILIAMLEPTELEIDCAGNGVEAVRMVSEAPEKYEMIFMDIQMPEMDGYEATRRIRALSGLKAKSIPIVAMTANVFKEDIDKSLEAGMNSHVGKPMDIEVILEKLRMYLLGKV